MRGFIMYLRSRNSSGNAGTLTSNCSTVDYQELVFNSVHLFPLKPFLFRKCSLSMFAKRYSSMFILKRLWHMEMFVNTQQHV
eukprot:m.144641 g.144641  ORF g.144641 m.144641 type:complete len:82 (+) comp14133_c0_seq7:986-1231(+)